MPPGNPDPRPTATVSVPMLAKFLRNPADAALRFHIRAASDWDSDDEEDFEPLISTKLNGWRLVRQTLESIARRSSDESASRLAARWRA